MPASLHFARAAFLVEWVERILDFAAIEVAFRDRTFRRATPACYRVTCLAFSSVTADFNLALSASHDQFRNWLAVADGGSYQAEYDRPN